MCKRRGWPERSWAVYEKCGPRVAELQGRKGRTYGTDVNEMDVRKGRVWIFASRKADGYGGDFGIEDGREVMSLLFF
jgi:hypothetical protein